MSSFTEARIEEIDRRAGVRRYRAVDGFRFYIGFVGSSLWIDIPAGFEADVSAKAWLLRLLPRGWARTLVKPAFVHDKLRSDPRFSLIESDAIFLTAMEANKTPPLLREVAFILVRFNRNR